MQQLILKLFKAIILFQTIFVFSCKQNIKQNGVKFEPSRSYSNDSSFSKISISTKSLTNLSFPEIISNYKVISLEYNDRSLFKDASKIIIRDSLIIIQDSDALIIFDLEGKFLSRISKKGRGPGEYIQIIDFAYISSLGLIAIADYGKLVIYKKDGTFVSSKKTIWKSFNLASIDSLFFVITPIFASGNKDKDYNLVLTDYNLEIIDKRIPLPIFEGPFFAIYGPRDRFNKLSNNITFHSYQGDTIYYISKKKISPKIILGFDKKAHVLGILPEDDSDIYSGINYREDKTYLFITYINDDQQYLYLEKKSTNKSIHCRLPLIEFDNIYKDNPYCLIQSNKVLSLINQIDPQRVLCSNPETLKKALNLGIESNHIIILYTINDKVFN